MTDSVVRQLIFSIPVKLKDRTVLIDAGSLVRLPETYSVDDPEIEVTLKDDPFKIGKFKVQPHNLDIPRSVDTRSSCAV